MAAGRMEKASPCATCQPSMAQVGQTLSLRGLWQLHMPKSTVTGQMCQSGYVSLRRAPECSNVPCSSLDGLHLGVQGSKCLCSLFRQMIGVPSSGATSPCSYDHRLVPMAPDHWQDTGIIQVAVTLQRWMLTQRSQS